MTKTIDEINAKIKAGKAVVVTAEEVIDIVKEKGLAESAKTIDVVTTGTFGPMCSSSVYFNLGHTSPRMKLGGGKATLNGVPAYCGFAAVDLMVGANALPDDDSRNKIHPGEFKYGGGHVIEDLVSGKDLLLKAEAYGTDCYPRKTIETKININDLNEAVLFNMRNGYQNYNIAVNSTDKTIYTYLGILKPHMANAYYSSAGQLSPLLNDPYYKTIGIGTRIFLAGGIGYIAWHGTQHNPCEPRNDKGVPIGGAGTLAVIGDLKQMSSEYLRGVSALGYGTSCAVGIGVPIPILNEEILEYTTITDKDIEAYVIDYGTSYPENKNIIPVAKVTYAELKSGHITINNKEVKTAPMSSYPKARKIAETLKEWIETDKFELTNPSAPLPGAESGIVLNKLKERK